MIEGTILLYVDPGSGSYLIQMIIAAILGAFFYFKSAWWRIKSFFSGKRKDEDQSDINDKDSSAGL